MTSQDAFDSGSFRFSGSIVTVLPAIDAVKALSSVPKDFPTRNFSHRRYLVVSATSQLLTARNWRPLASVCEPRSTSSHYWKSRATNLPAGARRTSDGVPHCTIRPRRRTAILFETSSASAGSRVA